MKITSAKGLLEAWIFLLYSFLFIIINNTFFNKKIFLNKMQKIFLSKTS